MKLLQPIQDYIDTLDTSVLLEERKALLQPLIEYINAKKQDSETVSLNFICTHNSRRSHLAQVWAQAMASYYKIENIACYSGGTEATAVYPMVVKTLEAVGFEIDKAASSENPLYRITYASEKTPLSAFSKKYDDAFNPITGFAAIMTCSQADAGCPFVAGSEKRISIMYEDPKISDGTPEQQQVYSERSEQIATEMKYVFSKIDN